MAKVLLLVLRLFPAHKKYDLTEPHFTQDKHSENQFSKSFNTCTGISQFISLIYIA